LACAAAWLTPDASAIIAGDAAATNVIASRARIFGFMPFSHRVMGLMGYESRVLNDLTKGRSTGESRLNLTLKVEDSIPSYHLFQEEP